MLPIGTRLDIHIDPPKFVRSVVQHILNLSFLHRKECGEGSCDTLHAPRYCTLFPHIYRQRLANPRSERQLHPKILQDPRDIRLLQSLSDARCASRRPQNLSPRRRCVLNVYERYENHNTCENALIRRKTGLIAKIP